MKRRQLLGTYLGTPESGTGTSPQLPRTTASDLPVAEWGAYCIRDTGVGTPGEGRPAGASYWGRTSARPSLGTGTSPQLPRTHSF